MRLVALHPTCGHNGDTLRVVTQEWADMLQREEASTQEFLAALNVVKGRCRFFPSLADLKDALLWVREHPPLTDEAHRLPVPPAGIPPEKRERVRKAIDIIRRQFTGPKEQRLNPEEARRQIRALGLV